MRKLGLCQYIDHINFWMLKTIYSVQSYIVKDGIELGRWVDQFCPQIRTNIQNTWDENDTEIMLRFKPHPMIGLSIYRNELALIL